MRTLPPPPRTRVRAFLTALLAGAIVWACTEGPGVTDGTGAVALDLVPSFQVSSAPFTAGPVDRIRMSAYDDATSEVLGGYDETVDPNAAEWVIGLGVNTDGRERQIRVEIELLSSSVVEWSGRAGPFPVRPGGPQVGRTVDVYRGPLDNLEVLSVDIQGAPAQLLVDGAADLAAVVELPSQSTAQPTVFWASGAPAIASVSPGSGSTTTVTAVAPGTTQIFAGAGPSLALVTLEVLPRVSSVVVTPASGVIDGLGGTLRLDAVVTDGFGAPDLGAPVTWGSSNASVATVLDGLVTAVGIGTAQISATSFGVTGTATVTVRGPDLVANGFQVVPDAGSSIISLADTEFRIDVANLGFVTAGASTVRVRILDAATGQVAHPPLTFPVPSLLPDESFSIQELGGTQIQAVTLPDALSFEALLDALDQVEEMGEANNVVTDGPYPVVAGAPPGFDVQWVGTTTDWATGSNWSTGQVPQSAQNVYIGAAPAEPTLTGIAQVADLLVSNAVTLTLGPSAELIVDGSLNAGQTITGSGITTLAGTARNVRGTVDGPVRVTGTVTADGPFDAGALTVDGAGASFSVGTQSTTVTGDFATTQGGVLVMQDGGSLRVDGDVTFAGGSTDGLLTSGVLSLGGDFTATADNDLSFAASGTHSVVIENGLGSTVTIAFPEADRQRFQHLTVDQTPTVTFASWLVAVGTLDVTSGSTVDATSMNVAVGEGLVDPQGGLTVGALYLAGDIVAFPASVAADVFVVFPVSWPSPAAITGMLTIDAALNVGPNALSVSGDVASNTSLTVLSGGSLAISGTLTLAQGSTLSVSGTVTAAACIDNGATISGSGSHPCGAPPAGSTWVGGAAGAAVAWGEPSNWNPSGVPTFNDDVVIPVTANDPVLPVGGAQVRNLTVDSGAQVDLAGEILDAYGDVAVDGVTINGTIDMLGVDRTVRGNVDGLRIGGGTSLSGLLVATGDLSVEQLFVVGDQSIFVAGSLSVLGPAAILDMQSPGGGVTVQTDVTFNGADHTGYLSAAPLIVGGDFTSLNGSFVATGAQSTFFQGSGAQTVSFGQPGTSAARFQSVSFGSSVGVTLTTSVVASGGVDLETGLTVPSGTAFDIGGVLVLQSGSTLAVDGTITAVGGCTDLGADITGTGTHPCGSPPASKVWVGGDATDPNDWATAGNWNPPGVPTEADDVLIPITSDPPIMGGPTAVGALTVNAGVAVDQGSWALDIWGDAVVDGLLTNGRTNFVGNATARGNFDQVDITTETTLSGDFTASDAVSVPQPLHVGPFTLNIGAGLTVAGPAGFLDMTDPSGLVAVQGPTLFSDAAQEGLLTAGIMALAGDLLTLGTDPTSFASSAPHLVAFAGSLPQSISFASPGLTASRLGSGVIAEGADVTLGSDVPVEADFQVDGSLTVPSGTTLDIGGVLTLNPSGVLNVDGTINAAGGCVNNGGTINGAGSQPCAPGQFTSVWVGGDAGGATSWANANNWQPVGVPTNLDDVFVGTAADQPVLAADAAVGSLVVGAAATVDLNGFTLTVLGDLDAGQTIVNGLVDVVGGGSVRGTVSDLRVSADYSVSGALDVVGDLTVLQDLNLSGQAVTVGGSFQTTGANARLIMNTGAPSLSVGGNVTFDGATTSGWLTTGTIGVGGDFTALATNTTQSFVGTGTHTVNFAGGQPQSVSFSSIGANQFQNVSFSSTASVAINSDLTVAGIVTVDPGGRVLDSADARVWVAGGLVDDLTGFLPAELRLNGNVSVLPDSIDVPVRTEATINLPNSLVMARGLTLNSILTIGAFTLGVNGTFWVQGAGGQLRMQNGAGVLDVGGDAIFEGADAGGWLGQGEIRVGGDFTVLETTSANPFYATGSHTVVLDGGGVLQQLTLATPNQAIQRFQNLSVSGSSAVTLLSDLVVTGTLAVENGSTIDASDDIVSIGGAYTDPVNGMTVAQLNTIGALTALPASLSTNVFVNSTLNLPNSVDVTGNVTANAILSMGANTLVVSGDFSVLTTSGQLRMQNGGGLVDVNGNVLFDGADAGGWTSQGEIRVAGDFTVGQTNTPNPFFASNNHTVTFDGGGPPQALSMSNPGQAAQRFQNVTVTGGSVVSPANDLFVIGTLDVQSGGTVNAQDIVVSVGGAYVDPDNGMGVLQLNTIGNLSALPAQLFTNVFVNALLNLPNSVDVTGNVTANAILSMGANTLAVSGDFSVLTAAGQLRMQNGAGLVDVAGSVLFGGTDAGGWLTQGEIRVGGDFTVDETNVPNPFYAGAAHLVTFDGGGPPQVLTTPTPGSANQRFQNLAVTGGSVVSPTNDLFVMGTLDVQSGAIVNAQDVVVSVGGAYTDPDNGMGVLQLNTIGNLSALPAQLFTNVFVNATLTLPGNLDVTGTVTANAILTIGASTLTVSGDFSVLTANGQLRMQNVGGLVDVGGNVLLDGADAGGWLTQGEIRVTGDFTVGQTNTANPFYAGGGHAVTFDGGGAAQALTLPNPGQAAQRFQNLSLAGGSSVTLLSNLFVMGTLALGDGDFLDASNNVVSVGGAYTDPGNGMTVLQLNTIGPLSALPAQLFTNVFVNATLNLPNSVNVTGNVTANAILTIGANTLGVSGDFSVLTANGQLRMQNIAGLVDVGGGVLFDGADAGGWLTQGEIRVAGDFTVGQTNTANPFYAVSGHTVRFVDGNATQTVTLSNPGTTAQRFQNLVDENFAGVVNLATSAVVMGTLTADDVGLGRTGPLGTALEVRGTADVQFTTLTGLPLRVTSSVAPNLHNINALVFQSMDPADVQLYLSLPGAGVNAPLLSQDMIFDSPNFTTGRHVETARSAGNDVFSVQFFNASPNPLTWLQGANTLIEQF